MNKTRYKKIAHYTKEQEMLRIKQVLKETVEHSIWNVRDSYKHREPVSVKRKSYLRVRFEKDTEGCEDGYSIEYDPCTFEILHVFWYSDKNGVYQEEKLTPEEIRALKKYYHFAEDLPYHATCE